jgi:hypothetical protein
MSCLTLRWGVSISLWRSMENWWMVPRMHVVLMMEGGHSSQALGDGDERIMIGIFPLSCVM